MISWDAVAELDRRDPLAPYRDKFAMPRGLIYLDGNSLGALPRSVATRVLDTVHEQWGEELIGSWNSYGWIDLPETVGEKIAPLVGAATGQVICSDSVSINLFKLLAVAAGLQHDRRLVLTTADNFPGDVYMIQGLTSLLGDHRLQMVRAAETELANVINEQVAVVVLSHVNFRSGGVLPMQEITAAAREAGALVIWDLSHSAGVMPIELDAWGVDFAVGCGYKFLNGGPGAPAFVYAASRHQASVRQPLSGWMGHREPFAFDPDYAPGRGILRFLCGTPPILSMVALDAALDILVDVDIDKVRTKSMALGKLMIELVQRTELADELSLASPATHQLRGSQLSWSHPQAYGLVQSMIERGVVADFREPDIMRVGFSPLYNSFCDVWEAVECLRSVIAGGEHLDARWRYRQKVT
jgi:kynureninase